MGRRKQQQEEEERPWWSSSAVDYRPAGWCPTNSSSASASASASAGRPLLQLGTQGHDETPPDDDDDGDDDYDPHIGPDNGETTAERETERERERVRVRVRVREWGSSSPGSTCSLLLLRADVSKRLAHACGRFGDLRELEMCGTYEGRKGMEIPDQVETTTEVFLWVGAVAVVWVRVAVKALVQAACYLGGSHGTHTWLLLGLGLP